MPIDRAATLRNAEKFLKQGKLDSAIAEYVRIAEDQPRDWNTGNALGDLYVRAGKPDKAIEQFARIADGLASEGFLPKAAALYKKVLKLRPDDERALMQAASIAAEQGLFVDARSYLKTVVERRRARGDARGAAEAEMRIGALDPADHGARIAAAEARARLGEAAQAVVDLETLAAELAEKGRAAEAVAALRAADQIAPDHPGVRAGLLRAFLAAGDAAGAREWASAPADYQAIADALSAAGNAAQAAEVLRHAVGRFPDDSVLRAQLARTFLAAGDVAAAAEFFDAGAGDPAMSFRIAEAHFSAGREADALALLQDVLRTDPLQREDVARLAWTLAERTPEVTFGVVELAAAMAIEQGDFNWAALVLQEFVRRIPGHIPALLRLVEVCVDGSLDRTTPLAQAQLADAYLDGGAAAEARVIAEDLAARNPGNAAHVERLRRAYALSGELDPDAEVARFLSPDATDGEAFLADGEPAPDAPPVPESPADAPPVLESRPLVPQSPPAPASQLTSPAPQLTSSAAPQPEARPAVRAHEPEAEARFVLESAAFDLESILRELDGPPEPPARPEHMEVDLSVALDDIRAGAPLLPAAREAAAPDIDGVFEQLRHDAAARRAVDAGDQEMARAAALFDAGDVDGALEALVSAARSPRVAFRAASLGARICRLRGAAPQAIEWLERASVAPAPAEADAHALLYELADLLEREGEMARALAVCLELQAEAGEYRDVAARVDRLAKAQARG